MVLLDDANLDLEVNKSLLKLMMVILLLSQAPENTIGIFFDLLKAVDTIVQVRILLFQRRCARLV